MKWRLAYTIIALGLVVFLGLNIHVSYAEPPSAPQATTGYTIDWWTVDGGGGQGLTGGSYTVSGTVGQPDAGTQSGGNYALSGGFWHVEVFGFKIDLPLIMR